jgi:hypothetical protein
MHFIYRNKKYGVFMYLPYYKLIFNNLLIKYNGCHLWFSIQIMINLNRVYMYLNYI